MKTLCNYLNSFLAQLLIVMTGFMVVCVVWQVLGRYIPVIQVNATDEIARFLLIWLGVVGAAYVSGLRRHLAVDLLLVKMPPSRRRNLEMVIELAVIAFAASVMIYGGIDIVLKTLATGQLSPVMHIKMGWIYSAVPISGVCIVLYGIDHVLECLNPSPVPLEITEIDVTKPMGDV